MPVVVAMIFVGLVAAVVLTRLAGAPNKATGETWTCGIVPNSRMEYTATGFAEPIRRAFGWVLNPVNEVEVDNSLNPYHGVKIKIHAHITHYINEYMYKPASNGVCAFAKYLRRIQTGSLQLYIGYIMAVTVILLIIATRW